MVECVRGIDDIAKYRRFRLLRPEKSVRDDPKAWWTYAIRCHGIHIVPKHRQREVIKENLRYLEIYTRIMNNPNEMLPMEQKEFKEHVEKERNYEELKMLREVRIHFYTVNTKNTN